MALFNSILVLSNPFAGKGRAKKLTVLIVQKLEAMKLKYDQHFLDWPSDVNNHSAVFLIGGDGTLNYFINKYKKLSIPIAIFKGGSGNDFAWKLYGNLSVTDYLNRVLQGEVIK